MNLGWVRSRVKHLDGLEPELSQIGDRDSSPSTPARPLRAARVQSVERAASLLRAVATASGSESSVTALAEATSLNRTTAWRILTTLEQQLLVALDSDSGSYSIGSGIIDLAGHATGAALAQSAVPVLQRVALQTGETAALAVPRDGELTYVVEAAPRAIVSAAWQGRRVAMHATSTGKALLAFSPPEALRSLLQLPSGSRLARYTDTTITDLKAMRDELELTRLRGFGVCRGEFEESAWGVSAPVLDASGRPMAVVSIWGPHGRLTEARFEALGAVAKNAATEICGR